MPRPPIEAAVAVEGERVADRGPGDGGDGDRADAHHEGVEGVLRAHQAGVEEAQRRGHHQHQRGRDQHPGGVAGVDPGGRRASTASAAHLPTGVTAPWSVVAGADPHRPLERHDEDLAVADLAGAGALAERLDRGLDEVVGDGDLEADLLREPHLHGGAAVGLDPVELAAVALHAADRDAAHLGAVEGLQHVVRLLGPDDADHEFHNSPLSNRSPMSAAASASLSARQAGLRRCPNRGAGAGPSLQSLADGDPYPQTAAQAARFPLAQDRDPAHRHRRDRRGRRRHRRLLGAQRLQLGAAALQPAAGPEGPLLGDLRRRRQPDRLHPLRQHPPAGLRRSAAARRSRTRRSRSRTRTSSTTARSTPKASPAPPGRTSLAGGKPVQGASTITQQLVRNLYIQQPRRDAQAKADRSAPRARS